LRRIGRYADGWLASFITPEEAASGIDAIKSAAADAGREIDPEHYGISVPVAFGELPEQLLAAIKLRRDDLPLESLIPQGWDAARTLIGRYIDAGMTKFVVRASGPSGRGQPEDFLSRFVAEMLPLQT
jgi:alkanesulfonate monooxygenase SsuD/methylene tetrahydromethanopterin reductase-like flavin-dependent oxidoreductase (luciferase family)